MCLEYTSVVVLNIWVWYSK